MKTFYSKSLPIHEVLKSLAGQFETSVQENCDEYTLLIPKALGKGFIKGIDFKNGLGIIIYECTFLKDCEIHFVVEQAQPLKFLICEKGVLNHRFENEKELHRVDLLENIMVASTRSQGHILNFTGGEKTVLNSLEIDRAIFEINHENEIESLQPQLKELFKDIFAKKSFYHHGNYCINIANLFVEIIRGFGEKYFLRNVYLEGCAYKILALLVLQYEEDILKIQDYSVLRKFELILVQNACSIINNEIQDYKGVDELATTVGLNANKLQSGFKEIHKTTVNSYVHDRRLDLASNLLKNSEFTISEIVDKIGLTSKSYFSKVFREKYGYTPSGFRTKRLYSRE